MNTLDFIRTCDLNTWYSVNTTAHKLNDCIFSGEAKAGKVKFIQENNLVCKIQITDQEYMALKLDYIL